MPSFNGVPTFFGYAARIQTVDNPRSEQLNKFFGLSGLERLDGGMSGRFTLASGVLYGATLGALAFSRESFRAFNNGQAYSLIDTAGVTWAYVVLESFEPAERILSDSTGFYLPYKARFKHLV